MQPKPSGSIDFMDALGGAIEMAKRLEVATIPDESGRLEPVDYALYGILGLAVLPYEEKDALVWATPWFHPKRDAVPFRVSFVASPYLRPPHAARLAHPRNSNPESPLATRYPAWVPWQICSLKRGRVIHNINVLKGAGLLVGAAELRASYRTSARRYEALRLIIELHEVYQELAESERYRLGLTVEQWPAEVRLVVSQQGYERIRKAWELRLEPADVKEDADFIWGSASEDLVQKCATAFKWVEGLFKVRSTLCKATSAA
ncbi:hypothetical protein JCM11641_008055 [Rhodosporidiobolus odoratus]